ncbi:MAG: hypothetical protein R2849_08465 [Thermomicrobiales bacterium]
MLYGGVVSDRRRLADIPKACLEDHEVRLDGFCGIDDVDAAAMEMYRR